MTWHRAGQIAWLIIRTIATIVWVMLRVCFIIIIALFMGGMRGASKVKMSARSGGSND